MSEFAKTELALQEIEAWDVAYISEEMVKAKHGVDQEEVRQYFPFTKVAEGFAALVGRLYGMTFKERTDVSVWNADVHFFEVYDETGALRGAFYADLFAREGKRSGAWMDDAVDQIRTRDGVQIPVAYLNCNFTKPKNGEVYLNHDEMITYFHEGGHVLHHILGKTEYADLAMMGVEWDTVELPSQLMESWCWEQDMLRTMSKHKKTGGTIPDELIQKLIDAKYFNCGLHALRQLSMGIYDFELYAKYDPNAPVDANVFHREIYQRMEVRPLPEYNRFPNSFGHIFGGGYGAGYFSYMWADGLVADVFAAYKESGDVYSREVGMRFLREVLEVGCSRPMAESFRAFRGRSLDTNILAKHLGLRS
jgi:oligopeptidase A